MTMSDAFELYVVLYYHTPSTITHIASDHHQLVNSLSDIQDQWAAVQFTGTYNDAKEHLSSFATYKQTQKRTWVTEKQDVATLFGNVQTKLKTYGLRECAYRRQRTSTKPLSSSLRVASS
jgi:hypothetical protein